MITTPPNTTQDQFIVTSVTGTAGGKNENTIEMIKKHDAIMLIARPHRPRVHGPIRTCSCLTRFRIKRTIGRRYEMKRLAIVSETMALNATVDPMLIRRMRAVMMAQKKTERRGSAEEPT